MSCNMGCLVTWDVLLKGAPPSSLFFFWGSVSFVWSIVLILDPSHSSNVGESKASAEVDSTCNNQVVEEALELASKQALEQDSEMFYRGAAAPLYLRAALSLLVVVEYVSCPPTLAWWGARALGTQQVTYTHTHTHTHMHQVVVWAQCVNPS